MNPLKEKATNWILDGVIKTFQTGKINLRTRLAVMFAAKEINDMGTTEETKKWYSSKTLWVNALVGAAGVLTALTSDKGLDPQIVGYAATALGIVNMLLRLVTNQSVGK